MTAKMKTLLLILVTLVFMTAGCDQNKQIPEQAGSNPAVEQNGTQEAQADKQPVKAGTMQIVIYHADKNAAYLVPEVHVVPVSTHPLQVATELLLAGTKKTGVIPVMPEGTKLRGIWIKDHVAYVNFSDKLIKNNSGGSAGEVLLVGAIVNTLTEFPEVQKVQLLVEGKKIDTITGHLDTSEPLSRSENLIKK